MLVKDEKEMNDLVRRSRKAVKSLVNMADKEHFKHKGDRQVMEVLSFVNEKVKFTKGKGKKGGLLPVIEKIGVKGELEDEMKSVPNESPKLYLFFKQDGSFEWAEVAGDKMYIHLQANDVIYAVFMFIGVFFVFHLGYPREHSQFLGFLQTALLGLPYDGTKSMGFNDLVTKLDEEMRKMEETSKFKKLCVNNA